MEEELSYLRLHGCRASPPDKFVKEINSARLAALHVAEALDNRLEDHIHSVLNDNPALAGIRRLMPNSTPPALARYQSDYPKYDPLEVDREIRAHGVILGEGQFLFHGGCWPTERDVFVTDRPFSTSFCPQIALGNASWSGKAYDVGHIDLMVVRVTGAETEAYLYGPDGDLGHEKEVVFAEGAELRILSRKLAGSKMVATMGANTPYAEKKVPVYVIEAEISQIVLTLLVRGARPCNDSNPIRFDWRSSIPEVTISP
ncbi:hypothetical protein [Pseudomonas sp. FW300-N2A2]|uniref:hypothetical protein n=1 Tax=Pseudomonas sp. FW300-N2A2 TaxID=2751316 RepID=UPI001A90F7B1|nr:hypothetical protein [Pseudomonas sp. FW300-N2A2]